MRKRGKGATKLFHLCPFLSLLLPVRPSPPIYTFPLLSISTVCFSSLFSSTQAGPRPISQGPPSFVPFQLSARSHRVVSSFRRSLRAFARPLETIHFPFAPLSLNLAFGSRTSLASHTDPLVRPQSAFSARPLKKNGRTSLDSPSSSSLLHPLSDSLQAFSALAHTPLPSPRPPLTSYHDPLPTPRQL